MNTKQTFKYIFVALLMLSLNAVNGQITVTNTTFPQQGDTLFTIVDTNPTISVGEEGEDQMWDFRSLSGPFVRETRFLDASQGTASAEFPNATMVSLAANSQESYYRSFNNKILEVGLAGEIIPGFEIPAPYTDEPTFRRAPLSYLDFNDSDVSLSVVMSAEVVPDDLLEVSPFQFDSLRIVLESEVESTVDAWGTVMLPNSEHQVIREKVVNDRTLRLFLKTLLGWVEIPQETLALLGELGEAFGNTIFTTYNFHSNDRKEIIASVEVDDANNAMSVEYFSVEGPTSIKTIAPDESVITAFPNPSFGDVSIQMLNYPLGQYSMKVFNIVGKELWSDTFDLRTNRVYNADLMHLSKGTYLYSIYDADGKKLVTKRIAIISI